MLKIRLTRRGKRNKAFFRLVVAEHTSPIKGKFIEALGFLNPHTKENSLKGERVKFWMEKGAQCSDSAHNMLVKAGILKGPKRAVKMKPSSAKASEGEKKPEEVAEVKPESASSADKEIKSEEKTVPEKEKEEKAEKPKTEKPKEEKAAKELKPARDVSGEEKKEAGKKPARIASQSDAGGDEEAGSKEEKKEISDGENK